MDLVFNTQQSAETANDIITQNMGFTGNITQRYSSVVLSGGKYKIIKPPAKFNGGINYENLTHDIVVTDEVINNIDDDFIGINWISEIWLNEYLFKPANLAQLGQIISNNGIKFLRYPGGNNVGINYWDKTNAELWPMLDTFYKSEKITSFYDGINFKTCMRLTFQQFMQFCRTYSIKVMLQFNTHTVVHNGVIKRLADYQFDANNQRIYNTGVLNSEMLALSVDSAKRQMQWVFDNGYDDLILAWELGNEEFLFSKTAMKATGYTGKQYAEICNAFLAELLKLDPDVSKYIVTGCGHNSDFALGFKTNFGLKSGMIAHHLYPINWSENSTLEQIEGYIKTHSCLNESNCIRLKALINQGINISMNEFNSVDSDSVYSHTWFAALGNAKLLIKAFKYAKNCAFHELYYCGSPQNGVYNGMSMTAVHFAKNINKIQPMWNAKILNIVGDNIADTTVETLFNNIDIDCTCVKNTTTEETKLIIVNIGPEKQLSLNKTFVSGVAYGGYDLEARQINIGEPFFSKTIDENITANLVLFQNNKVVVPSNTLCIIEISN